MRYDPLVKPDPEQWLEAEEMERVSLVLEYHKRAGVKLPNEQVHAAIHTVVENQAVLGEETPVAQTLERLMEEGLDRHDAVHAVGSVLADHIWELLRGGSEVVDINAAYFRDVSELTAREWLEEYGKAKG